MGNGIRLLHLRRIAIINRPNLRIESGKIRRHTTRRRDIRAARHLPDSAVQSFEIRRRRGAARHIVPRRRIEIGIRRAAADDPRIICRNRSVSGNLQRKGRATRFIGNGNHAVCIHRIRRAAIVAHELADICRIRIRRTGRDTRDRARAAVSDIDRRHIRKCRLIRPVFPDENRIRIIVRPDADNLRLRRRIRNRRIQLRQIRPHIIRRRDIRPRHILPHLLVQIPAGDKSRVIGRDIFHHRKSRHQFPVIRRDLIRLYILSIHIMRRRRETDRLPLLRNLIPSRRLIICRRSGNARDRPRRAAVRDIDRRDGRMRRVTSDQNLRRIIFGHPHQLRLIRQRLIQLRKIRRDRHARPILRGNIRPLRRLPDGLIQSRQIRPRRATLRDVIVRRRNLRPRLRVEIRPRDKAEIIRSQSRRRRRIHPRESRQRRIVIGNKFLAVIRQIDHIRPRRRRHRLRIQSRQIRADRPVRIDPGRTQSRLDIRTIRIRRRHRIDLRELHRLIRRRRTRHTRERPRAPVSDIDLRDTAVRRIVLRIQADINRVLVLRPHTDDAAAGDRPIQREQILRRRIRRHHVRPALRHLELFVQILPGNETVIRIGNLLHRLKRRQDRPIIRSDLIVINAFPTGRPRVLRLEIDCFSARRDLIPVRRLTGGRPTGNAAQDPRPAAGRPDGNRRHTVKRRIIPDQNLRRGGCRRRIRLHQLRMLIKRRIQCRQIRRDRHSLPILRRDIMPRRRLADRRIELCQVLRHIRLRRTGRRDQIIRAAYDFSDGRIQFFQIRLRRLIGNIIVRRSRRTQFLICRLAGKQPHVIRRHRARARDFNRLRSIIVLRQRDFLRIGRAIGNRIRHLFDCLLSDLLHLRFHTVGRLIQIRD